MHNVPSGTVADYQEEPYISGGSTGLNWKPELETKSINFDPTFINFDPKSINFDPKLMYFDPKSTNFDPTSSFLRFFRRCFEFFGTRRGYWEGQNTIFCIFRIF